MSEENLVTVQSEQHHPHGPELSPIDPSFVGESITVTKTKATKLKENPILDPHQH